MFFLLKHSIAGAAVLIDTARENIAIWSLHFILIELISHKYRQAQSNVFFSAKTYSK